MSDKLNTKLHTTVEDFIQSRQKTYLPLSQIGVPLPKEIELKVKQILLVNNVLEAQRLIIELLERKSPE